ncbi:glycosyltransferase family 2 protein [Saccharopolyspora spinosa]|uniref:glycosyltransferase family 2 protein n=1 Tax=Saccharopolyspora spinosa TaxID=60894 RepID=UPI00030C1CE1|nr:glycosyltransferase family 2 protein [Saccharopolyspora spinosa]
MTQPSVTIVVLSHNYERYVGEALESAVSQEPGDYDLTEVVVIDDGSTDRSHDVYARFPGVRVVNKAHEGFAATLTRAVDEASGEWLALLDADDAFTPDKLRRLAPHLANPAFLPSMPTAFRSPSALIRAVRPARSSFAPLPRGIYCRSPTSCSSTCWPTSATASACQSP